MKVTMEETEEMFDALLKDSDAADKTGNTSADLKDLADGIGKCAVVNIFGLLLSDVPTDRFGVMVHGTRFVIDVKAAGHGRD